ncbi:MAG: DUF1501 domain-containing protein [Myxococcota bacterium]
MRPTRRQLLQGLGALSAAAAIPALGLGAVPARAAGGTKKFCFVFNPGGWDPTRVFVPAFGKTGIDMEPDATAAQIDGLTFVDHPGRPGVRAFFEQHAAQSLILNGMLVRSVAHEICTEIALTGSTGGQGADWSTRIGAASAESALLPSLVLSGPSFPGDRIDVVARTGTNGQLQGLIDGRALDRSDVPVNGLIRPAEGVVDRYLLRRAQGRALEDRGALDRGLSTDVVRGLEKTADLKDLQFAMRFATGQALEDQAQVAVQALSQGVSRCVTLSFLGTQQQLGWDTHANNDAQQSALFEGLFTGLAQLMQLLRSTPGETEATLADETVVVVLSEMGRTPALNGLNGKDHWPYTSAMLLGPGLTGGRVVGQIDDLYYGQNVDPGTGEVGGNTILSAESMGATLLALADVDPESELPGIQPITGVLT